MRTSIYIFMAGDNNLDSSGNNDIKEMLKADLSDDINLLIQFDRRKAMPWEDPGANTTKRLQIKNKKVNTIEDIGETNTGDPAVLKDFLKWGTANYPAERNIAIIWNHGGGIKDSDIYKTIVPKAKSSLFVPENNRATTIFDKMSINRNDLDKFKMLDDVLNVSERMVCTDDTSRDFLDNIELKSALELSGKKFDIIAFDACLMSMFEIMYQLKDRTDYIIGSEEIEPAAGWEYKSVMNYLSANISISSKGLAEKIVELFKDSYEGKGKEITQSAIALTDIEETSKKLDSFAASLNGSIQFIKSDLFEIISATQKFRESDYMDLYDFAELVKNNITQKSIQIAAGELLESIKEIVIANEFMGDTVKHSNGISIYFPTKKPDNKTMEMYHALDFNLNYPNWIKLINLFHQPKKMIRR